MRDSIAGRKRRRSEAEEIPSRASLVEALNSEDHEAAAVVVPLAKRARVAEVSRGLELRSPQPSLLLAYDPVSAPSVLDATRLYVDRLGEVSEMRTAYILALRPMIFVLPWQVPPAPVAMSFVGASDSEDDEMAEDSESDDTGAESSNGSSSELAPYTPLPSSQALNLFREASTLKPGAAHASTAARDALGDPAVADSHGVNKKA